MAEFNFTTIDFDDLNSYKFIKEVAGDVSISHHIKIMEKDNIRWYVKEVDEEEASREYASMLLLYLLNSDTQPLVRLLRHDLKYFIATQEVPDAQSFSDTPKEFARYEKSTLPDNASLWAINFSENKYQGLGAVHLYSLVLNDIDVKGDNILINKDNKAVRIDTGWGFAYVYFLAVQQALPELCTKTSEQIFRQLQELYFERNKHFQRLNEIKDLFKKTKSKDLRKVLVDEISDIEKVKIPELDEQIENVNSDFMQQSTLEHYKFDSNTLSQLPILSNCYAFNWIGSFTEGMQFFNANFMRAKFLNCTYQRELSEASLNMLVAPTELLEEFLLSTPLRENLYIKPLILELPKRMYYLRTAVISTDYHLQYLQSPEAIHHFNKFKLAFSASLNLNRNIPVVGMAKISAALDKAWTVLQVDCRTRQIPLTIDTKDVYQPDSKEENKTVVVKSTESIGVVGFFASPKQTMSEHKGESIIPVQRTIESAGAEREIEESEMEIRLSLLDMGK